MAVTEGLPGANARLIRRSTAPLIFYSLNDGVEFGEFFGLPGIWPAFQFDVVAIDGVPHRAKAGAAIAVRDGPRPAFRPDCLQRITGTGVFFMIFKPKWLRFSVFVFPPTSIKDFSAIIPLLGNGTLP